MDLVVEGSNPSRHPFLFAFVAQLDRATDFESVGCTFDSCRTQKETFNKENCESGETGIHAGFRFQCFGVRVQIPSLANKRGNSTVVVRHLAKVDVVGSIPISRCIAFLFDFITDANFLFCGNSTVVVRHLAKVDVVGSIPISRSL